ncbi:HAD family hydrolase [Lachnoclostridium sp. An76]|uniref:HAD family hydrolase n=1 Tax=Lachnoclostridium sp. An76 TaxID=1965654 RepID=UPI000B3763A3|nr:HAD family phosphatase [Lachnoclostridium sp. An76]OUN35288.1 haloacid dehalogenase [Lachnoclostridium sp. An76]
MKYKNVVFDFGNVIGRFDGRYMLEQFCQSPKDCDLLLPVVYARWPELDKGTIGYEEYVEHTVSAVPARLEETVRSFFRGWPDLVSPIPDTAELIGELCGRNVPVYLLSNAPTYFADWASGCEMLRKFSGTVFSAPLKMAKPDPQIYRYLFETFSLKPEECFFIDDLEENVRAGRALGMDGIVFKGNIREVKTALGMK